MRVALFPPDEIDLAHRSVEDGKIIALAEVSTDRGTTTHSIVGVEQGDWVDEVHVARKNGDSRYGYILYLPLS